MGDLKVGREKVNAWQWLRSETLIVNKERGVMLERTFDRREYSNSSYGAH